MQKLYLNEWAGKILMNGESARILSRSCCLLDGTVSAKTEENHEHLYSVQPWLNTVHE